MFALTHGRDVWQANQKSNNISVLSQLVTIARKPVLLANACLGHMVATCAVTQSHARPVLLTQSAVHLVPTSAISVGALPPFAGRPIQRSRLGGARASCSARSSLGGQLGALSRRRADTHGRLYRACDAVPHLHGGGRKVSRYTPRRRAVCPAGRAGAGRGRLSGPAGTARAQYRAGRHAPAGQMSAGRPLADRSQRAASSRTARRQRAASAADCIINRRGRF